MSEKTNILRAHAEVQYAEELAELIKHDNKPRPPNWKLSPQAVATYLLGGKAGVLNITPKYIGNKRLIETAIATLATDRALLLMGLPGTAKSWLSEHLAAAIAGNSSLIVQGTAGISEEALRYGWNYAHLLAHGPSEAALVPSPIMRAMKEGTLARVEELTRIPAEVQDTLLTVLSDKTLPIPELSSEVLAQKGFNIIATANDKDRGVNEPSSALKRRFNTIVLPLPATMEEEVEIVNSRVISLGKSLDLPAIPPALIEIQRIVTIFRELRGGVTLDGKTKLKIPSGTLSTAEAISVLSNGMALAAYFGSGELSVEDLASSLIGAVIKDPAQDSVIWREYLETTLKTRDGYKPLYKACRAMS